MSAPDTVITKQVVSVGERLIEKYTLDNGTTTVDVLNYGATITSIKIPDGKGGKVDIVLGYDKIEDLISDNKTYFGSTIGRVANRIGGGSFTLNGVKYELSKNIQNTDTLHGGVEGFDRKMWSAQIDGEWLRMQLVSEDGDQGFPGKLVTGAGFFLSSFDHSLTIQYTATTDKATPVSLTNHAYFNLAGQASGKKGLSEHTITIFSDSTTKCNPKTLVTTGEIESVDGTFYDLRQPTNLGEALSKTPNQEGFDINYIFKKSQLNRMAEVVHPPTGRKIVLFSDQPGLQFYTGNFLGGIHGKSGVTYEKHGAFCLEAQAYPNAVNMPNFPSTILQPGETYCKVMCFNFNTKKTTAV